MLKSPVMYDLFDSRCISLSVSVKLLINSVSSSISSDGLLYTLPIINLERRIFMWDYNKGGDNWSNKILIILNSINCMYVYRKKTRCDIKEIENRLIDNYVTKWKSTIEQNA